MNDFEYREWAEGRPDDDLRTITYRSAIRIAPYFWKEVPPCADEGRQIVDDWWKVENQHPNAFVLVRALLFGSFLVDGKSVPGALADSRLSIVEKLLDAGKAVNNFLDARSFGDDAAVNAAALLQGDDDCDSIVHDISDGWEQGTTGFIESVARDCEFLGNGRSLKDVPVWAKLDYNTSAGWDEVRAAWAEAGDGWQFWIDWYEDALAGGVPDWDRLYDIALIPDEIWDGGHDILNPAILEIITNHRTIDSVEARTPNCEDIRLDHYTGLLTALPVPCLDTNLSRHIIGRVQTAIDRFSVHYQSNSSNFGPVFRECSADDLKYLREDLEDCCGYDLALHDAIDECLSSLRRKFEKERLNADPDVRRLLDVLERATIDIYAGSESAREVLEKRADETYRRISIEHHLQFNELCQSMAAQSDLLLQRSIHDDLDVADDASADPELRRKARYRTISRLPRGARAVHYSRFVSGERVVDPPRKPDSKLWVATVLGPSGAAILSKLLGS